jgi:MOSC domain-containing protein YiiM
MAMRTLTELDAHLDQVRASPRNAGTVELIVRRPTHEQRELLDAGELDPVRGLVGDNWLTRGSKRTPDGSANLEQQLTLMSVRVLAALEPDHTRWPLAGDQFLVDFDLSLAHLPAGAHVALGEALVEISAHPHTGCAKFTTRFGSDATKWLASDIGRDLRLRGVNAKIIRGGVVRRGDAIRRV